MAGLVQTVTFAGLADRLRRGALTPSVAVAPGGAGAGTAPPVSLPPLLGRVLAGIALADVRGHFDTGTAPDGTTWRPLRHPRPSGGSRPLLDTGELRASVHAAADATGVTLQTTHPGAALQNFGGVVRPKRAKKLAIPLTREARRAGSPRRFRRKLTLAFTSRRGVFLLVEQVKGRRVGQFVLVDKVTVPAREFLGLSARGWALWARAVAEFVGRAWEGA